MLCLNSHKRTLVTGSLSGAPFSISLSTFYIIGGSFIDKSFDIRWDQLYSYLLSNKQKVNDLMSISGEVNCNRIAIGPNIHHGIYGIMSSNVKVIIPSYEDVTIKEKYSNIIDNLDNVFNNIELGDGLPPNQIEYLENHMINGSNYYIPINPPKNTVRRALSYSNYIADGNTAIDAEPGTGPVPVESNGYGGTWFIDGDIRRKWRWSRGLNPNLSSTNDMYCDSLDARSSMFPTWKGISNFRKIKDSSAWIPNELYGWPCSVLYRFYSAYGTAEGVDDCYKNYLSVGFLWPVQITDPVSVMGFSSLSIANLGSYCISNEYRSEYARPYTDGGSEGMGVIHFLS